ncbi:hypothetical protein L7F22_047901 [Adiantum nelumboides]|nr:hypothetical protein [Adiantum nelumboides]
MVKEATVEASSGSPAEGTACTGLLYLSSKSAKNKNNRPLCLGLARQVNLVYKGDNSKKEVAKHGQALREFKYACMGHSLYRNEQLANRLADGSIQESDLPSCEGLVMLEVRDGAKQGQLNQNNQPSNESGQVMPRPPTQIRPPSSVKGVTPEDFGTKFVRSAGLVAAALKQNVYRVGNHIKTMVDDIFHSGGSGSK